MFDILFGWRKASKCKKLIKQVDQIIKDENTMAAYELLDNFCEFILVNLSYIRKHKDCPNDVNEAISSLIYASARCGELPELQPIRKLFGERYGHRFAMTAVELYPGNLVNRQIKEKLPTKSVSDDEKNRMIKEIARECLQPEILALEYRSDWHQKQVLPKEVQTHDEITEGPKIQLSVTDEMKRKDVHVDSYLTTSCESHCKYADCQQTSQYILKFPKDKNEGKVDWCNEVEFPDQLRSYAATNCKEWKNNGRACTPTLEHKEERKTSASSCESLPQFPEEKIVYLDDVVELCSSTIREGDKRLFKFNSPSLPKSEIIKDTYDETDMEDGSESWSEAENSSSKSSGKSRNGSGKGSRRRSMSKEMQRTKDIECVSYSGPSFNSSLSNHPSQFKMSHYKNILTHERERSEETCSLEVKDKLGRYVPIPKGTDQASSFNHRINNCSLEKCPISMGRDYEQDNHEISSIGEKSSSGKFPPTENLQFGGSDKEIEWANFYKKQRKKNQSCNIRSAAYDVFNDPNYGNVDIENMESTGKTTRSEVKHEEINVSVSPMMKEDGTKNKPHQAPYVRAATMPTERPKDNQKGSIPRTNSCPYKHPNHVHPKLPEYEDIAAKFMALKRQHLQNNSLKS